MSHPNNTYVGAHIGCNANYTCILDNVIVGAFAGTSNNGSGHTVLGACAGQTMDASTTNNIAIGFNAQPSTSTVSNTITLGNSSITTIRAAVTSITAISDARDKTAVHDLAIGLDFVNDLHPVEFTWARREPNPVKDGTRESGFLAQEVSQVVKDHLASDYLHLVNEENPDQLEIAPSTLIPVLVKALQQLSEKHEKLAEEFSNYVRSHP
jgi:hypothetical protein